MQYSDGVAHTLTFFEDTFTEIPVTAETYEAEKALGLYYTEGSLKIPPGTEEIVFTYYTPAGAFIERQNVFILKDGIQGEDGQPAPMYLGAFSVPPAARSDNTPLRKGDTYLNKTDRKLYRYDGLDWIAVPDEDPGWWEALGDAVKEAAESGVQITAANAWVEKLVAGTVLAQKLFAKEITIPTGGVIQSQNFSEGTQGFRIMGNGGAEFNNGTIRGTINATGGKFENVEIQNCTGNISFTVTAGNNFILKPIKDLVPIGSGSARDSVRIVASGTIRLSFHLSCSIWRANVECYVWKIPIQIIDRKLLVNGVQQALSGHNFNGSFVFDLPITAGETISAFADSVWSDYDEEYSIVKITAIQLLVKDNPGVLSVLN